MNPHARLNFEIISFQLSLESANSSKSIKFWSPLNNFFLWFASLSFRFVLNHSNHSYGYRPNWTPLVCITIINGEVSCYFIDAGDAEVLLLNKERANGAEKRCAQFFLINFLSFFIFHQSFFFAWTTSVPVEHHVRVLPRARDHLSRMKLSVVS